MFTQPDRIGQLAREHRNQMLAEASQWRLQHQHARPAPATPGATARITRRLTAAIARFGSVAAAAPGH
jgi:hypothetical protein